MILAGGSTQVADVGYRVEVYKGWRAGHTTTPNTVINLDPTRHPKAADAAGNYLFVSDFLPPGNPPVSDMYAYNLTTGALDITMTNSNPAAVYVGFDVDSMYGVRAIQKANGDYMITKDNYQSDSVIIYTLT